MKIEIRTPCYNQRRFSCPWIARVEFDHTGTAHYEWGQFISDKPGDPGLLVLDAPDSSIVSVGQKDHRGNKGKRYWYVVRDNKLVALENSTEAYKAYLS